MAMVLAYHALRTLWPQKTPRSACQGSSRETHQKERMKQGCGSLAPLVDVSSRHPVLFYHAYRTLMDQGVLDHEFLGRTRPPYERAEAGVRCLAFTCSNHDVNPDLHPGERERSRG